MSSTVAFAIVVLCYLATIIFKLLPSLSVNLGFRPLSFFIDDVLPVLSILSLPWVLLLVESLNSSAVFVKDTPANLARTICRRAKSERSHMSQVRCGPISIANSSRCRATLSAILHVVEPDRLFTSLSERLLQKMPHTDGGKTWNRREFSHRLQPSSPDNRVLYIFSLAYAKLIT